ncbi:MAG: D-alanyl-D-alanine carboxypeptidase [bacterium]|nr:D-alanyl-D-alanine carboxypeptidase [bacterium]
MDIARRRAAALTRPLPGLRAALVVAALVVAAACSDGLRPTLVDGRPASPTAAPTVATDPGPEPPAVPTAAADAVPGAAPAAEPAPPASDEARTASTAAAPMDPVEASPASTDVAAKQAPPVATSPSPQPEATQPEATEPPPQTEEAQPEEASPAPEETQPLQPEEPQPDTAQPEATDALPIHDEPIEVHEPAVSGSGDEPSENTPAVPRLGGATTAATGPSDAELVAALDALAARAPAGGCLVVRRAGETVFSANADALLIPASLQKLLLAEAALEILGAGYTFSTVALADAPLNGGVLDGDLYLVGGGDPLLSTPDFVTMLAAHNSAGTPLADLAANLVAAGLTRMTGGVVAVADRYDTLTAVPTWPARFATQRVAGSLSAVSVNQGLRAPPGLLTSFGLAPQPAPALSAAAIFDDLLEAGSVRIPAVPRVAESGGDYRDRAVLASLESAPLAANLHWLLAESDNTLAEMLLKEIGLVANGAGTSAAGARAVHAALAPRIAGLAVPADGSGLSPQNRLSCSQVADSLDLGGPDGLVAANLGVAGRSGTMENRFRTSPARDLVRAKTGSLNGVASLAGFAEAPGGEVFNFTVILNSGTDWIDRDAALRFFADLLAILVTVTGG